MELNKYSKQVTQDDTQPAAQAMLHARDHITPDDIKNIALPVLRHRVGLAPEMELEGYSSDQILQSILDKIEAPRQ